MSHDTIMDPAFVAERLKGYRQLRGITQENLADLCGLSTRSIENYESGRRLPDKQACRSLLRGMEVDADFFRRPTPDETDRSRKAMEDAVKHTVVVPVERVASVQQVMEMIAGCDCRQIDFSQVGDGALDLAAELEDLVLDWGDIWEDIPATGRLEAAREILDTVKRLDRAGFAVFSGRHLARQCIGPDNAITMRFLVLLATPKDQPIKCALVRLGPGSKSAENTYIGGLPST